MGPGKKTQEMVLTFPFFTLMMRQSFFCLAPSVPE